MDSVENQYGIDVAFVSEVPDYLKCLVCHLVLRKPLQIIKCGHRICEPCFTRMKSYSENNYHEFRCPFDQDIIDCNKVFEDNGINRLIGDLAVNCMNNSTGCVWTGDLRNLLDHEKQCNLGKVEVFGHRPATGHGVEENSALLKELCEKMLNYENSLAKKEKETAFLKFNLQELKKEFDEKLVVVDFIKNESETMKVESLVLKQVQLKSDNVCLKNIILEQKVESLEKQLASSKRELEENQEELATIKRQVIKNSGMADDQEMDVAVVEGTTETVQGLCEKSKMKEQSDKIDNVNEQKADVRCNVLKESTEELKDFKNHVMNIESVLFLSYSSWSKGMHFTWRLQNYQYHFKIGKPVESPLFFPEIDGYRIQLKVDWPDEGKTLYYGFRLWRGDCDIDNQLDPFNKPVKLLLIGQDGKTKSKTKSIERHRDKCYTIFPGEMHSRHFGEFRRDLSVFDLQRFIVNDTLTIKCEVM